MLKKCNKIISAFLALMMLCTLLPASAFAAGEPTTHLWTVTFDANGGTGTMGPVTLETENDSYLYTAPECEFTAPDGMEFDYWTLSGSDTPIYVGETIEVSSNITLVAHWRQMVYYYLVSFDANGGTGDMIPLFIESTTATAQFVVPACTFTPPEGMVFSGWIDETGRPYTVGRRYSINGDVTLIAQWAEATTANFTEG